jgi:hypothetical protein
VECRFSILSRQTMQGAGFTSPGQVRKAIDDFVEAYNQKAAPFEWEKAVVFPSALSEKYADLCNDVMASGSVAFRTRPTSPLPRALRHVGCRPAAGLKSPHSL